eukprot:4875606-Pyramimonas_sp.AAC.1
MLTDEVARVLVACAAGKWSDCFSAAANWGKFMISEEGVIIILLRIASTLFSEDGGPTQRLHVDARSICIT